MATDIIATSTTELTNNIIPFNSFGSLASLLLH